MKRKLLSLLLAVGLNPLTAMNALADNVAIDATNFPDENFRSYVSGYFDRNGDGVLSEEEIANVTGIYANGYGITSLEGIEYFHKLEYLYVFDNNLTTIDVSANTNLIELICGINSLTELDVSANTNLCRLYCNNNNLTTLDVSANSELMELAVDNNTNLTSLDIHGTKLTSIDLSNNIPNLKELNATGCGRIFDKSTYKIIDGKSYIHLNELIGWGFVQTRLEDPSIIETMEDGEYFCVGESTSMYLPCERTYEYNTGNETFPTVEFTISTEAQEYLYGIGLNEYGYATYSNKENITIESGATAYTVVVDEENSVVWLTEIGNVIPAGTGVLLIGNNNGYVSLLPGGEAPTMGQNDLHASLTEAEPEGNVYVLSGEKFVRYTGATLTLNKAYLVLSDAFGATASSFRIARKDDPTAIVNVNAAAGNDNAPTYNLNGQRVNGNVKGIVVRNGKKMIRK